MSTDLDTLTRTFKYRIYPTASQVAALELHLSEACRLYNAALQERRDAWRMQRKSVSFYDQTRQLTEIRSAGDVGIVCAKTGEQVLRRVDRAFRAFFRRVRSGDRPGYPRFKSVHSFDSFTAVIGNGATIVDGRVVIRGVGALKAKWHRPLSGKPKAVIARREGRRWFVCILVVGPEVAVAPASELAVGVDLGLTELATLSDGSSVPNDRHAGSAHKIVRRVHRALSRCHRGSKRRRLVAARLQAKRRAVARRRADAHHKATRAIVSRYGYIAVEDLNIRSLARTRLAKSIHDAAWASFINKLTYKAESAGRVLVKVDPRGTSQACLCGASVPKTLAVREHVCHECGLVAPRDLVSAQLIERLGRSRWSLTMPTEAR